MAAEAKAQLPIPAIPVLIQGKKRWSQEIPMSVIGQLTECMYQSINNKNVPNEMKG